MPRPSPPVTPIDTIVPYRRTFMSLPLEGRPVDDVRSSGLWWPVRASDKYTTGQAQNTRLVVNAYYLGKTGVQNAAAEKRGRRRLRGLKGRGWSGERGSRSKTRPRARQTPWPRSGGRSPTPRPTLARRTPRPDPLAGVRGFWSVSAGVWPGPEKRGFYSRRVRKWTRYSIKSEKRYRRRYMESPRRHEDTKAQRGDRSKK
jgi:hypothetical protein